MYTETSSVTPPSATDDFKATFISMNFLRSERTQRPEGVEDAEGVAAEVIIWALGPEWGTEVFGSFVATPSPRNWTTFEPEGGG